MSGMGGAGVRAETRLEIKNQAGLHMRAVQKLMEVVRNLDATVTISKDDQTADLKNIIQLMMLAASKGSIIDVVAEGPDAQAAVDAITALVEAGFNETDESGRGPGRETPG